MKKHTLKPQIKNTAINIDYEGDLNQAQTEIVKESDGYSLILAGAGTGKTRTLVYRVAYLLDLGIDPQNILLVTFTNKASKEMLDRINIILGYKPEGLWAGTFHHIGHRVLRMYGEHIGLANNFQIIDQEDSRNIIRQIIKEMGLANSNKQFPKANIIQSIISYSANVKQSVTKTISSAYPHLFEYGDIICNIAKSYNVVKRESNSIDFDDLLTLWLKLLIDSPETNEKLSKRFHYILIDEYQDTNIIQSQIVDKLSLYHKNLLVVGDDAQSIYSFRGALIQNILNFPTTHPNTKTYKLEYNYRSSPQILGLANNSIANNEHQFKKILSTGKEDYLKPIRVDCYKKTDQTKFVIQRIQELVSEGQSLSDIAVLFRAHHHSADIEMELIRHSIPYIIRGGVRFFDQAHIKDVISFLRILNNPNDKLSWMRSLKLMEGIGDKTAKKIFDNSKGNIKQLPEILCKMPHRAKAGLKKFIEIFKIIESKDCAVTPSKVIESVVEVFYTEYIRLGFENPQERLDDLIELIQFAARYANGADFISDTCLGESYKTENINYRYEKGAPLILSTIHQAKGLEWETVFIIGLSEGQFPHPLSYSDTNQIEEERRLFYVATTRAKNELYLICPLERFDRSYGSMPVEASCFIEELDCDCFEKWTLEYSTSRNADVSDEALSIDLDDL